MEIYERYPMMRPFVGDRFHVRSKPSILLVGESHYLPGYSVQHNSAETWYKGDVSSLSPKEQGWINTSGVVEEAVRTGFRIRAHSIYKESFKAINRYGPQYSTIGEIAHDIAYLNFFLRPALQGKSLSVTDEDATIANEVFLSNVKKLNPTGIVILSSLAARWLSVTSEALGVPIVKVPHPASHWWNRKAKKYGSRTGKEVLESFVISLKWPK